MSAEASGLKEVMENSESNRYFRENAAAWLADAYSQGEYNYPVGLNRIRIVTEILKSLPGAPDLNLLDLGCGGGDLCIAAAQLGFRVIGIDQSSEMIAISNANLHSQPAGIASRVALKQYSLDETNRHLAEGTQDAITAMGLIGYLPSDDLLFALAHRLLKAHGRLIVSCRNRLFNMVSISNNTIREIEDGTALPLIDEIEKLYHPIPEQDVMRFLQVLQETTSHVHLESLGANCETKTENASGALAPQSTSTFRARQHTSKQLNIEAEKHGFANTALYGVHPHLLIPRLNALLPPQIFNKLSDCLCAFEKLPISLLWSSVFIAVYQKG